MQQLLMALLLTWTLTITTTAATVPVFRGTNYIRLHHNLPPHGYHSTFSPLYYNATRAQHQHALASMARDKYTLVRVFLDPGNFTRTDSVAGDCAKDVLGSVYLDNVADFVGMATAEGVKVMVTFTELPTNAYFQQQLHPLNPNIMGTNTFYLHPGGVQAKADYLRQFIRNMHTRLSPAQMNTIAVYSIENEAFYTGTDLPFSSTTLKQVTTADGMTYDMTDKASRQQCADANAVHWANTVFATIRQEHPGALATVGMFTFQVGVIRMSCFRVLYDCNTICESP